MENCSAADGCSGFIVLLAGIAELIANYPYVTIPVIGVVLYIMYKNAQPKEDQ